MLESIIDKRNNEVDQLSEEELSVYEIACERFENSATYLNCNIDQTKQSLKHQYGLYQVEIYNRVYNKRERDNHERQL